MRAEGWVCAPELPASLKLYDVHQDTTNGSLQFSYSDGLFNVSLFEQRGALDPAAVAGFSTTETPGVYLRYGMPSYVVWSSGGIVYTLIGDLPPDMLGQVVRAFPHDVRSSSPRSSGWVPGWRKSPPGSLRWVRSGKLG